MTREQMIEIGGVSAVVLALLYYYLKIYTPPMQASTSLDTSSVSNATPIASGGGIDWSIFNPSSGSDAGTAMTDYTSLLTDATDALTAVVKNAAQAGNSNLFPLFGYAANTGDVALRYQSHDTSSSLNLQGLPYQSATGGDYIPKDRVYQEMGVVMDPANGRVYQVPANSIPNVQQSLNSRAVGEMADYNNRTRGPQITSAGTSFYRK